RREWDRLFRLYFNAKNDSISFTESMAPFFFFRATGRLRGYGSYKPVVSIDIGGGTTDVVVFQDDKPLLSTSFRFAANVLFGDGFAKFGGGLNGIVNKYAPIFDSLLSKNHKGLQGVLKSIRERGKSEDVLTFLF